MSNVKTIGTEFMSVIEAQFTEIPVEVTAKEEIKSLTVKIEKVTEEVVAVLKRSEGKSGLVKFANRAELELLLVKIEDLGWKYVKWMEHMDLRTKVFLKVKMETSYDSIMKFKEENRKQKKSIRTMLGFDKEA